MQIAEQIEAVNFTPYMPKYYKHVREYGVTHPNGKSCGALLKNLITGLYVIYNTGVITNVPQGWAARKDERLN